MHSRSAVNRSAELGMLYNARRDSLLSGSSIIDPVPLTMSTEKPDRDIHIVQHWDCMRNRLSVPFLESDLKLSILTGMVTLTGSGECLQEHPRGKELCCALIYTVTTRKESVDFIAKPKIMTKLNKVFENQDATHVVSGITWGARAVVTVGYEGRSDQMNDRESLLNHLLTLKYRIQGRNTENVGLIDDKYLSMCFYSDFNNHVRTPSSFQEVVDLFRNFDQSIAQTTVPLTLTLFPISSLLESQSLYEMTERDVVFVEDHIVNDCLDKFDKFQKLLIEGGGSSKFLERYNKVSTSIKKELEKLIVSYRSYQRPCNFVDFFARFQNETDKLRKELPRRRSLLPSVSLAKCSQNINANSPPPEKRRRLQVVCPGSNCGDLLQEWRCVDCKDFLAYGFDSYFYCRCGCGPIEAYVFLCVHQNHGKEFISYNNKFFKSLRNLKPLRNINILILGETGVGKSTWINSLVNYLTYPDLDSAIVGKPKYVIPVKSFAISNDVISAGDFDNNETNEIGKSSTIFPRIHQFEFGDSLLCLMDTPGVGDTGGVEKDNENFDQILLALKEFDVIHGICMLFKSNTTRLTLGFQHCVKELLVRLHSSASENIFFCMTHSRSTFYKPGDTLAVLKALMDDINVHIKFNPEKIYCMDNEAFKFLIAHSQGINNLSSAKESIEESWKKSMDEFKRLVQTIQRVKPHNTNDTLSLNHVRLKINTLLKPLAAISMIIEKNKVLISERREKIENYKKDQAMSLQNLYVPRIRASVIPLQTPRTVCASEKCQKDKLIELDDGSTIVNYGKGGACHEPCNLLDVSAECRGHPALQYCAPLMGNAGQNCTVCNCHWKEHMHLTYTIQEVVEKVENQEIKKQLRDAGSDAQMAQVQLTELEREIENLGNERTTITRACAEFSSFLKKNAMIPFNDSMEDYLKLQIKDEHERGKSEIVEQLEKSLIEYQVQMRLINESVNNNGISLSEINKKIEELYKLPLYGQQLRDMVIAIEATHKNQRKCLKRSYTITTVNLNL